MKTLSGAAAVRARRPVDRLNAAVCGLVLAAGGHAAWAQSTLPAADLTQLPFETLVQTDVLTASRLAKQVSESHTAVSVVTADDIRAYGYQTLADVIAGMRGLFTTYDHRYQYISGRGNGAAGDFTGRLMVLVDGLPMQDNMYDQVYVGHDGRVDMELVERVEYIPGPGSVAHGNNALLGVISVTTKKGADLNATQLATEWMSRGGSKQRVSVGHRLANGADVLLSVSRLGSDGHASMYFPYYDSLGQRNGVASQLDAERSTRVLARLMYEGLELHASAVSRDKLVPYATKGQVARFGLFRQMRDDSSTLAARYDYTLSPSLRASSHLYRASYDNHAMFEYPGVRPLMQYLQSNISGNWWGLSQSFAFTGWEDHTVVWGAGYRRDDKQQYRWNYLTTDRVFHSVHPDAYDYDTRHVHAYVADDWAVTDGLRVNTGLRHDRFVTRDCSVSPCRTHELPEQWHPRLALVAKPAPHTTLKLSRSGSFRMPNVNEMPILGRDLLHQVTRVKLTEAVVEHELSSRTRVLGSVYRFGVGGEFQMDPQTGLNVYNARTRTSGAELQLDTATERHTRLRASVAWQKALDANGDRQVNSPRLLAKVQASAPVWHNRFRVGLEALWVGNRLTSPLRNSDNVVIAPPRQLGGYGTVNLTLSSQAKWHGWAVSAGVKNLFNRRYESAVRSTFPAVSPAGVVFDSLQTGDRTLWLQLTYDHWN